MISAILGVRNFRLLFVCLTGVFLTGHFAFAAKDVIEFPTEELAAESVLPVFDKPESVKNRNVVTANRLELGLFAGYLLTEPFFNPFNYGLNASYHFNETHGLNLTGLFMSSGLSSYGKQLNNVSTNSGGNADLKLQNAPAPKYMVLGSWQFTGYYGKLSITKQTVANLSLYGLLGAGMIGVGDAAKPMVSAGLGQKFYISHSFALRFDLRFYAYQGPDVLTRSLSATTTVQPNSAFDEKLQFGSMLSLGAVYLFPGF